MIEKYDPLQGPDPAEWSALDESEMIALIEDYHVENNVDLPNATLHSAIHSVVENQVAMGDELNVARNLQRLMSEGLDRHDAVHAIGTVLSEHLHTLLTSENPTCDNREYAKRLDEFTADDWLAMEQESE